ncbi:hypothetical protein AB0L63_24650 [Nocardia sp. NPDC051990]|uniref:hypothetical protein n=1 Tax=Nocardia sp. NPDC051990 TaxID=3155285 RepID=UPI00342C2844
MGTHSDRAKNLDGLLDVHRLIRSRRTEYVDKKSSLYAYADARQQRRQCRDIHAFGLVAVQNATECDDFCLCDLEVTG